MLSACDRPATVPSDITKKNKKEAIDASNSIPYKAEIEAGLTKQFNYRFIPIGQIQIMSDVTSKVEEPDSKRKRFRNTMLKALEMFQEAEMIVYKELRQGEMDLIKSMGTRVFVVTPLKKALDASDPKESNPDLLAIQIGNCEILSIVKDIEYQSPLLPQSDDFRLIVGTYKRSFNGIGREGGGGDDEVLKFRALLKFNPFNQTHSFQTADWGDIKTDVWKTANVLY